MGDDCNDSDINVWTTGYGADNDGDGYGLTDGTYPIGGDPNPGCYNGAGNRDATLGMDCQDDDPDVPDPGQCSSP